MTSRLLTVIASIFLLTTISACRKDALYCYSCNAWEQNNRYCDNENSDEELVELQTACHQDGGTWTGYNK